MNNHYVLDKTYEEIAKISHSTLQIWLNTILFSWRWWIGIALTLIPWILWIIFHDKRKTGRLLLVGLIAASTTSFLDAVGLSFGLWHYDWKVLPLIDSYVPWDYSLFPVSVMSLLQFKPKLNPWIKAVVFSFACSFVFEPLFVLLWMYHLIHWSYFYSFIIYIVLYYVYHLIYKAKFLSSFP
jgi:hypothetical protein